MSFISKVKRKVVRARVSARRRQREKDLATISRLNLKTNAESKRADRIESLESARQAHNEAKDRRLKAQAPAKARRKAQFDSAVGTVKKGYTKLKGNKSSKPKKSWKEMLWG